MAISALIVENTAKFLLLCHLAPTFYPLSREYSVQALNSIAARGQDEVLFSEGLNDSLNVVESGDRKQNFSPLGIVGIANAEKLVIVAADPSSSMEVVLNSWSDRSNFREVPFASWNAKFVTHSYQTITRTH